MHQHQPTLRHVSHTMWCRIGIGTSIHVKSLTCVYAIAIYTMYYFADDNSRVCLKSIPGVIGSDYINASFISVGHYGCFSLLSITFFQGYQGTSYIAAQG